ESLPIACLVGTVQGVVDHVEVGVLMIVGGVAQRVVRLAVGKTAQAAVFQSDQAVKVDRVEIEFEIRMVRIFGFNRDGHRHEEKIPQREMGVIGIVFGGKYVPADLKQRQ